MDSTVSKHLSISVFFPAYNDAASISGLVLDAIDVLPSLADEFEVIVINDGSSDDTRNILDGLASKLSSFRAVHHSENRGYGAALRSGFAESKMDLVFYTDGDGQYDVRELAKLVPLMSAEIDVVNGFKASRADGFHRRLIGNLYSMAAKFFFRLPIRDVDCDFRLIRRDSLRPIELSSNSGAICVEIVKKLTATGSKFAEVPVSHFPRKHGKSQFFTPRRIAHTLSDFFGLWIDLVVVKPNVPQRSIVEKRVPTND